MTPSQIQTIKQALDEGKKVFWTDKQKSGYCQEIVRVDTLFPDDDREFAYLDNNQYLTYLADPADIYIATGWTSLDE